MDRIACRKSIKTFQGLRFSEKKDNIRIFNQAEPTLVEKLFDVWPTRYLIKYFEGSTSLNVSLKHWRKIYGKIPYK